MNELSEDEIKPRLNQVMNEIRVTAAVSATVVG